MISSQLKDVKALKLFLDVPGEAERQSDPEDAESNSDPENIENNANSDIAGRNPKPKEIIEKIPDEILHSFQRKVDYNLQDHKGRSAFILACQENEVNNSEPDDETLDERKEAVKLFLKNADRLSIDLHLKDNHGKNGFDYLPETWIEEMQN